MVSTSGGIIFSAIFLNFRAEATRILVYANYFELCEFLSEILLFSLRRYFSLQASVRILYMLLLYYYSY